MKTRFDYKGTRRSGELVAFYTSSTGKNLAKVREDGSDVVKSFEVARMLNVESGPFLTDDELLPLLKHAANSLAFMYKISAGKPFTGNVLQLLLGAAYITRAGDAARSVEEATKAYTDDRKAGVL